MTKEQAQQVLDELNEIRPEQLEGNSKRLFEAIMLIADERDEIKQKYDRDTHILQNQLDLANATNVKKDKQINQYENMLATNDMLHVIESQNKDKVIDLMAEDIDGSQIECNRYFKDKEEVKEYFENKAKEILNK